MVSLSRRQVLIGGIACAIAPAIPFPVLGAEKLILSGRVLRDGRPAAGAGLTIGGHAVLTDADGRFMVVGETRALPANADRDADGVWRATVSLTL